MLKIALFTSLFSLFSNLAFAQDKQLIELRSMFELQSQKAFESDDRNKEYQDIFARNETNIKVNFTNNLRLESQLVFERIKPEVTNSSDSHHGNDRSFNGEGIYTEELKLVFEKDNFDLFAGKFNPNYGTAFNRGRGIWSHEVAENYQQTQKLGFGGSYEFKPLDVLGKVRIGASLFHDDSKILDGSTISNKSPRISRNDGTPGNNNNLESFVISIDGSELWNVKDLKYHLAYLNLKTTDDVSKDNQTGFVSGLNHIFHLNDNLTFDSLIEHSKFSNFSGTVLYERDILTANIVAKIKQDWKLTLAFSEIEDESPTLNDIDETFLEFSGGYYFPQSSILNNFSIEAGYKYYKDFNNIKTESLGVLSRYIIDF